jgi:hypothetical protein
MIQKNEGVIGFNPATLVQRGGGVAAAASRARTGYELPRHNLEGIRPIHALVGASAAS